MDPAGKVAVVTGASSGIGRALAEALARRGCRLLLSALEADGLAAVARDLECRHGARVEFRAADLTAHAEVEGLLEWIRASRAPPDLLVANAGGATFGRFSSSPWADVERTLALNVVAPTRLVHGLMPLLRARPKAKVVLVSSGIARLPYPGLAVYGACKGYLSSLAESLACEARGTSVDVLCFHPGFTRTRFLSAARMDVSRVPEFLFATPERVAALLLRAIERDCTWAFADLPTRLSMSLGGLIPARLRGRLLHDLFWRLPDEA